MRSTIIKYTISYFFFYSLWSFVFTQTVFFPPSSLYAGYLLLFVLFLLALVESPKKKALTLDKVIWMPFLLYTILGYLISLDGENTLYRIVCVLLLLLAGQSLILDYIPKKFIFWSGIFASVGIFIQFLLPSFYNSFVLPLFTANQDRITSWIENGYGFSGFYYQLSHADMNLLMAEALIFCFLFQEYKDENKKRLYLYISVILIFLAILLTGKRSFAVMAILIPLMVHILGKKQIVGIVTALMVGALVVYLAVIYFVDHIADFSENVFLHRLAETVEEIQYAQDISSGREDLAKPAMKLFEENPVFGIGAGNYVKVSHQYTDVHNAYLQVLCEQGLIGLVLMLVPMVYCLINTISLLRSRVSMHYKTYIKYSLFIQIYFALYSFTGNTMVNYEVYFIYFLAIAILINVKSACLRTRKILSYNYEIPSSMQQAH